MKTNTIVQNTAPKSLWKRIIQYRVLYLFLAPTIIYIVLFSYIPMYGVQIAFRNYNGALGIWGSKWVGLKHITDFLGSYYFWPIMRNTLTISIYSMLASLPFPIILALMLNEVQNLKYKKFVQTVLYAPYFISMVVMVGIIIIMLSPSTGVINFILEYLGFPRNYFMIQPNLFKHIYVWSGVWQSTGWGAIIYLAALSNVNIELHEAAKIDGANRIKRIFHINIPAIKPTIIILTILSIGGLIGVGFEKAFLLQNELNLEMSEVISTYVYRRGLLQGNYSFSTAVDLFNNIINLMLLVIANFMARKAGETSLF